MGYQYTEICTDEGNSIIFTNSALFDKNFLNLTRNNPYEYLKLSFTVKYDTDVESARALLKEACQALLTKDKEGRDIVEPGYGLHVVVDKFDENGISFALKQDVLVSERYGYISRAKEIIFKTLIDNHIEIPFQQIAVHMVQDKEK
jgi:small-conductance mechanosensitive channel